MYSTMTHELLLSFIAFMEQQVWYQTSLEKNLVQLNKRLKYIWAITFVYTYIFIWIHILTAKKQIVS